MIDKLISTLENTFNLILGSATIITLSWGIIWTYSIWSANKRHGEVIHEIKQVQKLIRENNK